MLDINRNIFQQSINLRVFTINRFVCSLAFIIHDKFHNEYKIVLEQSMLVWYFCHKALCLQYDSWSRSHVHLCANNPQISVNIDALFPFHLPIESHLLHIICWWPVPIKEHLRLAVLWCLGINAVLFNNLFFSSLFLPLSRCYFSLGPN